MSDEQSSSSTPPPEPMPWDRVGSLLGDMASVGKTMADRNLKLWSNVSRNLRTRPYKMDQWSDDAAQGMQAALANAQDAWEFVMRIPERERVADTLPTAFVLVQARDEGGTKRRVSPDPIWLRAGPADADRLPQTAQIDVTGGPAEGGDEGAKQLRSSLKTTLGPSRQAYLLELVDVNDARLKPGVYSGSVYVKTPSVRPIANLRVIVE